MIHHKKIENTMTHPLPIIKRITFFDTPAAVGCDGKCNKAWGANTRPKVQISDDPDDFAYMADHELGEAPEDPGTYECDDAKPTNPEDRLNRWCVRECERSAMTNPDGDMTELPDFSSRRYNIDSSK